MLQDYFIRLEYPGSINPQLDNLIYKSVNKVFLDNDLDSEWIDQGFIYGPKDKVTQPYRDITFEIIGFHEYNNDLIEKVSQIVSDSLLKLLGDNVKVIIYTEDQDLEYE